MQIDNTILNADLNEILVELQAQLHTNQINLIRDLKDSGDNIQTQCVYHKQGQEKRPSAGIRKDTGIYHCFTCGETHTLPEVISHCFGHKDFGLYGKQWLLKNFATLEVEERKEIKLEFARKTTPKLNSVKYVSEEELDSYRYYHPYMYKRKLTNEVIEKFDIGFDKATNCITFNCRNKEGTTLFVARRSVNTKWFNYPSGSDKEVYGIYELYSLPKFPNEVYICESMLDCLYLWTIGKYACALNGLGCEKQFEQLNNMPCRVFILATDNDSAGKQARFKLRKKIKNKLLMDAILPSNRKDINECTLEELQNLKTVLI